MLAAAWGGAIAWPLLVIGWLWRTRWRPRLGPSIGVGLISLAWACCVWGFLIEPQMLVVRHVAVKTPDWSGPPIRIGVISDIHAGGDHQSPQRLGAIVSRMNAEKPDLILLLGDYAAGHDPMADRSAAANAAVFDGLAPLRQLSAPLGVKAVLGNHDFWFDADAIRSAINALGVEVLENQAIVLSRPGGDALLAGLNDLEADVLPSYAAALENAPTGLPTIVMAHEPDVFQMRHPGIALTLAGHSHCGQVNLPVLGRPILPSPGSQRWPCGLYEVAGRRLYVSGGLGVSILPVRFNQPPEIAVVTISGMGPVP